MFAQVVKCEECGCLISVEDACSIQWMTVCENCKYIFDLNWRR